ncbi:MULTISPECIES: sensory rhodopsin transducer [unclassified Dietzia]|uniref:sensory rhodopsin transducer n=1 Tax=unclassified Dietzia TaxID=2617939 RepID=UPI000D1FEB2A|nr:MULTISPECIES: sensory rhodopsin transducer [unclassified Dietzia]AVZ38177.1 sensory rhodopsin transducer [Dietzia sp. JS16-p6b]MBB1024190.1 sensory rhodopsin transducer [Dietzia sp. DQ12-76]MBB1026337.1 sensory rhodopsin transducer [Dietzia sp. DQ11-38-2]QGW23150.1 hypothetical protein GJR88_00131 [Dietzia sp. DQ12-45-1b]
MNQETGRTLWVFPGGNIPSTSTGPEPEYTSRDELCILNVCETDASLEMTVYHSDGDPVGPYPVQVAAQRVRHVRVNDLIDPQAVFLGEPYGMVIRSDVPVFVQVTRLDTRRGGLSGMTTMGFAPD